MAKRRHTESGPCRPDGGTPDGAFYAGLGGSFGSLSFLRCATDDDDDNVKQVEAADDTNQAHEADALSRRPTRESVHPNGVASHSAGMPGDSGVGRHEAHQALLTQMLETAAAHVVAQKHADWLSAQRLCAEKIQGARSCQDGWLADPTIDAV